MLSKFSIETLENYAIENYAILKKRLVSYLIYMRLNYKNVINKFRHEKFIIHLSNISSFNGQ